MRALAIFLLGACTAAPPSPRSSSSDDTPAPAPSSLHLAPAWKLGDQWTVRYRLRVSSMVQTRNPPPAHEEHDWTYAVVSRTADTVQISAFTRPEWVWRLEFGLDGRLLEWEQPFDVEPTRVQPDRPYFDLYTSPQAEVMAAWPRFPVEEEFGVEQSDLWQRVQPREHEHELVLVRKGNFLDADVIRTGTMRWEDGRPWWSALRIEAEYTYRGEVDTRLEIEGEVIEWPRSTP